MSKPFHLDFKKFKKVSADKNSTTLRHADGHEIKIAHSALSPKHREMLAAMPAVKMADGGEVSDDGETSSSSSSLLEQAKQKFLEAKESFEKSQQEHFKKQQQLFGMGEEAEKNPLTDEQRMAIASEMGVNAAMGTMGGKPLMAAAESLPETAVQGYKKASDMYDVAAKGLSPAKVAGETKTILTPLQQVQRQMNKAGAKRYADGGDVQPEKELIIDKVDDSEGDRQPNEKQLIIEKMPEEKPQLQQAVAQPMGMQDQAPVVAEPQRQPGLQPSEQVQPPKPQDQQQNLSMNPTAGYEDQLKGLDEQYKAEKEMAALKARDLQTAVAQQQKSLGYLEQAKQDYQNEWNKLSKEISDGKINPDDYWKTHSKVGTAIGLIIAGFNPTSRPNAAAELLQHQMDQNLQAQLANLNSKHNLIAAATQKYGNLRSGIEAAQILQTQMLSHKLDLAAAQAADPMARAKMLQLSGQLKLQAAPQIMRFNVMQGAMKAQQDGNAGHYLQAMRFVDPAMAKEMEARFVPDGANPNKGDFAVVPIPEKAREEMIARSELQNQVHNLREWAKANEGKLQISDPAAVNYGKALAASVQDAYRRANGQGVFKESESDFVKGIVHDDPTSFFNKLRVDPKYKALEDSNLMELNGVRRGYGLPPKGAEMVLSPQEQQLVELARKMPNSPKARMFLKSRGME